MAKAFINANQQDHSLTELCESYKKNLATTDKNQRVKTITSTLNKNREIIMLQNNIYLYNFGLDGLGELLERDTVTC